MNGQGRDDLLDALTEKKALIERFLALTVEQTGILQQDEVSMEAFLENLRARQAIIEKAGEAGRRVNTLLEPWLFADGAGPEGAELARLQEDIQNMLERVAEIDRANQGRAKKWMEYYGAQIKKSQASRRTIGAYQQSASFNPGADYFDKRQ